MVAENNACAEGEEGMARLEKQVGTAFLAGLRCSEHDRLLAFFLAGPRSHHRLVWRAAVDGAGGEGGSTGLAAV